MKIVLASGNRNKFKEMKDKFEPIGVELLFGGDLPSPLDVDETGQTYEENSLLKASAWAKATGLPAMSDDSGLEVAALDGAPGVHSARVVAGSDAARVSWLLGQMEDKSDRRARFACCISVVFPNSEKNISCLRYCNGSLAREPRGASGFGYDPIFIPLGYDETFAELGENVKTKISHRALAIKGIAEMLLPVVQYQTVRTVDNPKSEPEGGDAGNA